MLKNQTNQKNILKILKNEKIKYQFKRNHTGFLHTWKPEISENISETGKT